MLEITEDPAHGALLLEPSGKLERGDFAGIDACFDAWVARRGQAPNLVIHARDFPGWADFAAFTAHFAFIRAHANRVDKVALVSDSRVLDLAPKLASHLVQAEIRHFPDDALAAALDWVAEAVEPPGHVTPLPDLPAGVIGISVEGTITARDYAETIIPLIETALGDSPKIRLIYRVGPGAAHFTAGAAWSDARLGLAHLTRFERIALVSDIGWVRQATQAFAPLMPAELRVFADAELEAAKSWIGAPS